MQDASRRASDHPFPNKHHAPAVDNHHHHPHLPAEEHRLACRGGTRYRRPRCRTRDLGGIEELKGKTAEEVNAAIQPLGLRGIKLRKVQVAFESLQQPSPPLVAEPIDEPVIETPRLSQRSPGGAPPTPPPSTAKPGGAARPPTVLAAPNGLRGDRGRERGGGAGGFIEPPAPFQPRHAVQPRL